MKHADLEVVLRLYETGLAELGGLRDQMMRRLCGETPDAFCPVRSRVLVLNDKTIGLLFGQIVDAIAWARALVVAPEHRDGLANLRLLHAAISADQPVSPERIRRFETLDSHRSAHRAAHRLRATETSVRWRMRRGTNAIEIDSRDANAN